MEMMAEAFIECACVYVFQLPETTRTASVCLHCDFNSKQPDDKTDKCVLWMKCVNVCAYVCIFVCESVCVYYANDMDFDREYLFSFRLLFVRDMFEPVYVCDELPNEPNALSRATISCRSSNKKAPDSMPEQPEISSFVRALYW